MGGNNSTENLDGKIFGPSGSLMNIDDILKIQDELKDKYPKLSEISEEEKVALMPKLRRVYDLIDNWRSDVYLQYREMKAVTKEAERRAEVPIEILGALVSLLAILPGLKAAWGSVQIAHILKTSVMTQNDIAAFLGKGYQAANYAILIGSKITDSCRQTTATTTF
ncbi:unnamed protein product, partial [Didymodactylos carnosus]